MDSKGIEIQGLNLFVRPEPFGINQDTSFIKPVESITQDMMGSVMQKKPQPDQLRSDISKKKLNAEDARTASELMSIIIEDSPELEADWKLDEEQGVFVVIIKEKGSDRIIRQIPAEEVLAGLPARDYEKGTGLLSRTV
jgi:uncharacterized FlaG/YvyC family protein